MESFIHLRKGKTPRRLHADLDGLKDDGLGRGGFTGRTANLYRRHDPTAYRSEGPLRPIDVLSSELKPSDATDAEGGPLLMFANPDCRIFLSRREQPMPYFARHVDGDLLCFVHQGAGLLETEFGPLRYRAGDWVYLPKACTWRQVPDAQTTLLMIEASGDNFAFTFNIADYNVVTSDSVHLPPTVHLFMQATGVYVMNFLPKPAEGVPGTERTPWYHRNVDYDEIAFFHGGSLYGIPMPPGLISHAPQGVHHGAPEKARARARRKFDEHSRVDWQVIAVDTRRRLTPSAEVLAHDLGQH
jgi:homogentisate 1,2-dioxygenase